MELKLAFVDDGQFAEMAVDPCHSHVPGIQAFLEKPTWNFKCEHLAEILTSL